MHCTLGQIKVVDSLFIYCDKETENVALNLFWWNTSKPAITDSRCLKRKDTVDCGLFAIANSTAIAFGENLKLKQEALRSHLVDCFHVKNISVSVYLNKLCNL